jgi:uncharacterized protein (DUF1697 family)
LAGGDRGAGPGAANLRPRRPMPARERARGPFVALLRAVNLGGPSTIRTAELRERLVELGFGHVGSVAQSGNLVFDAPVADPRGLELQLESALATGRPKGLEILVRTRSEWRSVIEANPFTAAARDDPSHLLVAFLKDAPPPAAWSALERASVGRERIGRGERHAYLVYPDGVGRSLLTTAVVERHLGVRSTARNWNTVTKLAGLLEAIPDRSTDGPGGASRESSRTTK